LDSTATRFVAALPAGLSGRELPTLAEVAYRQVRDAILSGELAAGQQLGQVELANQIGTSRVPLREALQRLEAEGLVVLRPRRGYIVTSLDREEITDIFDIRMILEERAGYLATLHATPDDVAAVEELLLAMDGTSVTNADEATRFAQHNRAFHDRLYAASGRNQLCHVMSVLRTNVERYIRIGALIAGDMRRVRDEHWRIFDAFRRGDAQTVGHLCREHCQQTCDRLLARLAHDGNGAHASSSAPQGPDGPAAPIHQPGKQDLSSKLSPQPAARPRAPGVSSTSRRDP
jgi:DNA-binding GntR family transcriptional regulator